jgi:hypothetical protein
MYEREIETRHLLQRYPRGGVAPSRFDLERYNRLELQRERATPGFSISPPHVGWGTLARAAMQVAGICGLVVKS